MGCKHDYIMIYVQSDFLLKGRESVSSVVKFCGHLLAQHPQDAGIAGIKLTDPGILGDLDTLRVAFVSVVQTHSCEYVYNELQM